MVRLDAIFAALAGEIAQENVTLREEGLTPLAHTEIRVMGQMSLLSNTEVQAQIRLIATVDVDATVRGEFWVQKKFEELLLKDGLELDPVASEIWLPAEATFTEMFSSNLLTCLRLDALYALVSKAIKAKEKNRILIRQALPIFGRELEDLIKKYGGDLVYFEEQD